MQTHRHTIRNIDPDLILEARILALQTGRTLGELVTEALEAFIDEADDDDIADLDEAA